MHQGWNIKMALMIRGEDDRRFESTQIVESFGPRPTEYACKWQNPQGQIDAPDRVCPFRAIPFREIDWFRRNGWGGRGVRVGRGDDSFQVADSPGFRVRALVDRYAETPF